MLRKRLVGAFLVVATSVGGSAAFAPRVARAQEVIDLDDDAPPAKGKKGGKAGKKDDGGGKSKKKGAVDIDLDEGGGGKGGDSASAGQMTEEAAAAKRLFDKERWAEAATALFRVIAGETGDDPGNQQDRKSTRLNSSH